MKQRARDRVLALALALAGIVGTGIPAVVGSTTKVLAEGKSNAWSLAKTPTDGNSMPVGQYTSGCLQGAAELALDGPGFQVMHPSRVRYYGHPDLVSFVQHLGEALRRASLADLMVGDLSQPRGGPAPGGHSSHQTGLDVDLWYWTPEAAAKRRLSKQEREETKARSVLDPKTSSIRAELSERVLTMLRLAAQDTHVERIFVHPIIKRDACKNTQGDRAWLHKLRPWYGHDDHFHVRLECPAGATDCVAQTPSPRGDGCAELDWWFSPEADEDRKKGRATYQAKVGKAPGMPEQCKAMLSKPARAGQRRVALESGGERGQMPLEAAGDATAAESSTVEPAVHTAAAPGASL